MGGDGNTVHCILFVFLQFAVIVIATLCKAHFPYSHLFFFEKSLLIASTFASLFFYFSISSFF